MIWNKQTHLITFAAHKDNLLEGLFLPACHSYHST